MLSARFLSVGGLLEINKHRTIIIGIYGAQPCFPLSHSASAFALFGLDLLNSVLSFRCGSQEEFEWTISDFIGHTVSAIC